MSSSATLQTVPNPPTATTVEKIAAFVSKCDNQSIAPDVRDEVAKHVLDSIGCVIGAIGAKVTEDIKSVVDTFGGKPISTLIGEGTTSPDRAALYNGCLVRYLALVIIPLTKAHKHPILSS
jgi:2-methylcitrate dehydratase